MYASGSSAIPGRQVVDERRPAVVDVAQRSPADERQVPMTEEQRVTSGGVPDLAAQEERPDALAERGSARLAGQQDVVAAALERRGQTPGLAALACAVRTLEGDESTSDPRLLHGAKSTPGQPSGGQPSAPCWVVRKAGAKVPFRGSRDQATIWRVPSPKMILDEGDRATLRRILAAAIAEAEANENQPAATLYDGGMVCGGRGYQRSLGQQR